jgi:hypothetical protein
LDRIKAVDSQTVSFDKINAVIAALVFLISIIVYNLTKAPSFSFWDCGELVACSYILGIPHPPGSPLYILIGRFFTILPIAADLAARVNLFSVISSAVATLFGYLIAVRLIRLWFREKDDTYSQIIIYVGGFTGALFMAFSSTNWGNSVESEVYAPTIMLMMLLYWLALKYLDSRDTRRGERILLLTAYLAMLGVGIHLTLLIVLPVLGLYFILKTGTGSREWALAAFVFVVELYLIFHLSSRPGEAPIYLPVLIFFVLYIFHLILEKAATVPIKISLGLFILALYPFYFVIIRAFFRNFAGTAAPASLTQLSSVPIGWIGFFGLAAWGLFSAVMFIKARGKAGGSNQWLLTMSYSLAPAVLAGIGSILNGYHAFLLVSGVVLIVALGILRRHVNWMVLLGIGSISMVILGFWHLVWGLVAAGAGIIVLGIMFRDGRWKIAVFIVLLAALAYTVHAFIPIRSAHNPRIDENNPSQSFGALVGYLERKQYGAQSMIDRMFARRGGWENQFGDYRRMGFWHFFKEQYGISDRRFFIILILGLFGIWETIRRRPDIGLPFFVIILLSTAGIVLYMNFADGTRQDSVTGMGYIEVRNRDYFFTPGFVFFGLAIGLGIAAFIDLVRDSFRTFNPGWRKAALGVSSLLVLIPFIPLKFNYFSNDRSRNYMAYDYAHNFLRSCPQDAIFITNGDNDTFPIWCIQEVHDVRKDVRNVNLSLANTKWYIKQLRDRFNVPVSWTDDQIDRLVPYIDQNGTRHRIQDQVVDHIIATNRWKAPICFAVTVPDDSRRFLGKSIQHHLKLEGMVYRLTPEEGTNLIDFGRTRELYEEQYEYRGVADPTIFKNESTRRIIDNYAQGFLLLADTLRRVGDYEGALRHLRNGLKILPESFDIYGYSAQMLGEMGRLDTLAAFMKNAPADNKEELYLAWGASARRAGRMEDAISVMELTHRLFPDYQDGFRGLVTVYFQNKNYTKLRKLVSNWVARHPDDYEAADLLRQIESVDQTRDTMEGQ